MPRGGIATLSLGAFNGDGQNKPANSDSTLVVIARVSVRPIPVLTLAAEVARYNRDSTRYGVDGSFEWRGITLRGEYIAQHRRLKRPVDWGFFGLAAHRVTPLLQLVLKRERFQRPAIAARSTTPPRRGASTSTYPGDTRA